MRTNSHPPGQPTVILSSRLVRMRSSPEWFVHRFSTVSRAACPHRHIPSRQRKHRRCVHISIVLQTRRKSTGMSPHRSSKFLRGNCHRCRPHDLPDKCQTDPQRLTTLRTVFLHSQTQPLRLSKHGEQEFFRYSDNLRHKQRHS